MACDFVSFVCVIEARSIAGVLWILLAAFFDDIEPKVACLLDGKSELGATPDFLPDVVSFAMLPGVAASLLSGAATPPDVRRADRRHTGTFQASLRSVLRRILSPAPFTR